MSGLASMARRQAGLALAVISVLLPALPFGPLAASPPLPLAALWLAYGYAARAEGDWRAPAMLTVLGLLHDQTSGGPLGLMALLYVLTYLFGGFAARMTSSISLATEWAGFIAAVCLAGVLVVLIGTLALGGLGARNFLIAAGVTILLFPVVRRLYGERAAAGGSP